MKNVIVLFGLMLGFLSCHEFLNNKISEQENLKQYIESKDDIEIPKKLIPIDKFVFFEIIEIQTAEIIPKNSNSYGGIPIKSIDFPTYQYNDTTKEIKTWDKSFKPNYEEFKIVFGNGIWLGKNRGRGGASSLFEIKYLPFYNGETAIYEIDSKGTIFLRHENIYYKLNLGETIKDSTFFNMKIDGDANHKLKVKREFEISNYGILNKKAIVFDTIRN